MPAVIVVGTQWGDEGKGKIVDLLAQRARHVVRSQGGSNAGHTVVVKGREYRFHLVPSGILSPQVQCYIGAGTVIDPQGVMAEIEVLESEGVEIKGRLAISEAAHVIFSYHNLLDCLNEKRKGERLLGTTGKGIGPCYADKVNRIGLRMGEFVRPHLLRSRLEMVVALKNEELEKIYGERPLCFEEIFEAYAHLADRLKGYVRYIESDIDKAIRKGENVLFEAAQGTFLDLTLGTYPFVTSSHTTSGGVCSGAGIGPTQIDHTLGVVKAYTTRVGQGPFPTELLKGEAFVSHEKAREIGTTTGRQRRIGWLDLVVLKESIRLNGIDSIAVTKLDVLDTLEEIKVCVGYRLDDKNIDHLPTVFEDYARLQPIYETFPGWLTSLKGAVRFEDLPAPAQHYLLCIESLIAAPITLVSIGPERERTIMMRDLFER